MELTGSQSVHDVPSVLNAICATPEPESSEVNDKITFEYRVKSSSLLIVIEMEGGVLSNIKIFPLPGISKLLTLSIARERIL